MQRQLIPLILGVALAGACAGTTYTASATWTSPELVHVGSGVYAVANYDYPVYYADNYYWRFYDGRWYRSPYYTGGWSYAPPTRVIARIDRPYTRYYMDRDRRIHVDRRYRPTYRDRPQVIHRGRTVERERPRVLRRD